MYSAPALANRAHYAAQIAYAAAAPATFASLPPNEKIMLPVYHGWRFGAVVTRWLTYADPG